MVEELKLAIKIDDATVEQSLLKQFANAQKMADKVVLDFKNVNFDDKQIEAKFKEMQKKAGQNPIDLSISGNTLDMLGQIDKRLTEIFSIGKGKSFIDSSSTVADIGKIENKINELNKKYEEAQKKLSSIGSGNISGKDVNLVDNKEFQKLSQEVSELKNQFDDLKTHMQLLDDYTVPTDRFFELQSQVETTTVKVSDLVEEFTKLSNAQKALSSTLQESNISLGDSKEQSTEIDLYHNLEKRKVTYDEIIDKIQTIISLKEKEKSLSKTSDDTKLYQKLYDENDINWAGDTEGTINRISDRLKEIYIKYNGKISLINENDIQEAAYLLDILKGAGESPNLNKSQEKFYQNKKFSNDSLFDNIHVDSQKTGEIDKINTELSETYRWFNQLEGVSLNENIANEIKSLISDMQIGGKNANEYANDLLKIFNIEVGSNSVVEQQNKLQSELKETESQAEKTTMAVKEVSSTASTEQKKDAFPSTGTTASIEKLEQVSNANKEVQKAVETSTLAIKENAKAIDNGELPALDELVKKANEAAYELTKGKDIVSQIGEKQVYKVTETDENGKTMERIVGQFSYVEKSLDGQLKNVLATYDESTGRWNEEVLSLATNFEKVGKEIISLDNKINKLEMHRDKMVSEHPNYDTSADDELIDVQKSRRFVLEQTLGLYANEKEYVYEIDAFEKRRIENNRTLLALKEQQNNSQKVKTDEKADKQLVKDWEDAIKFNQEYDTALEKTNELLSKLSVPKELESQWLELIDYADKLRTKLANNEIGLSDYKSSIKSKLSEYNSNVGIQQKRDIDEYNSNVKADNAKKLEREKQIWNELTTSLERYATIQKRIASNNALSTDNEEATKLLEHIYKLQRNDILPTKKLTASNEKLQQINQTVTDLKAKLKESTLDSLQGSIDKYQKIYDQRSTYSSDFTPSEQYTKNLTELNTAIGNLVEYRNTLKNVSEVTVEQETHLKGLVAACEKASDSFKSLSASEKGASQIAIDKLVQRINKDLDECTNYSKEAKLGLRALRDELESTNPRNLKEITSEIINIENAEIKAGRAGKSFFDTLKNSGFHQIAAQMAGMFGFYDVINLGKEGFNVVRELNTALTEMRKVSDESLQSLKNYQNTTFDTADAVGTTAKQIQASTADYMRLGESLDEAAESAKTANVLLNVSEFDNIEDATKSLVAMGQAYKDLDKMTIVDKLNEVGNNYAISTDELATALQKSASTLSLMGNTIDEAASLVTTANATIQDADSVSAGLRTISLRLVGTEEAKKELSAMNEEVDAFVKATNSKKQQIIKDYTAVASNNYQGFDILDSNGNYKNTYEILLGIAKVYKEIQEQDKKLGTNHATALIEELAGKNRSNIASAILRDPTQLEAVKKSSEEAMGSAEKELNSYLDSIDGKMAQLENRAQEFWFKAINSETIKNGIDLLSTLLKGATDFVDTVGLLPTILTGIGAVLSFKNVGRDKMYSLSF